MCLSGPSTPASQDCISARVIASSEAKGSSSSRTGRPAISVRRKATRWRIPPESSSGRAPSNPASPSRSKCSAGLRPGSCRERPGDPQGQRRVVERRRARAAGGPAAACTRSARGARSASVAPADRDRAPSPPAAGRRPARAGWSCRTPMGRRCPTTSPGSASRSIRSIARSSPKEWPRPLDAGAARPPSSGESPRARRGLRGPRPECLREVSSACSLRAHYRTGSKGQRRVCGSSAISARSCPASPPVGSSLPVYGVSCGGRAQVPGPRAAGSRGGRCG